MPREGVFARVLHGGEIHVDDELVVYPFRAGIITASDKGSREREKIWRNLPLRELIGQQGYVMQQQDTAG